MKQRIKIDTMILSSLIGLTGFLYIVPSLYVVNPFWDGVLDMLGFLVIFHGIFLRMSARGHKMKHSRSGEGLVTSGPYKYMRNPMYLGSFLLGCGSLLLVWPWWLLPLFVVFFYIRFRRQVVAEEQFLSEKFGKTYESYCDEVPRLVPNVLRLRRGALRKDFRLEEIWLTKEKYGLAAWPLMGFLLEIFQEKIVFGSFSFFPTATELLIAGILFELELWFIYRKE